jgi:hypothetical protein
MEPPIDMRVLSGLSVEMDRSQAQKKLFAVLALIGFSLLATGLWIGILFWMAWQTVGAIALTLASGPT